MSLEDEFFDFMEGVDKHLTHKIDSALGPILARVKKLEEEMTSSESAQDALNTEVSEINDDVTAVANELAAVIQQNQQGGLTADQVTAALQPIHQRLTAMTTTAPQADPTTNTDPTNSPAPDSPAVNPAPDAPTDNPTPDPTVNPVDVNPASQPPADDNGGDTTAPSADSTSIPPNGGNGGFVQDV